MRTFDDIIEEIKNIICKEYNRGVYDSDVAKELGLTQSNFAVRKSRLSTPFFEICIFCEKRNISINKLLFGS